MPESLGSLRANIVLGVATTGTMLVGFLILIGGPIRFSAPSFAAARAIAPWWAWGLVLGGAGLIALVGIAMRQPWWCRIGHAGSSVGYAFLVFTFIQSAIHYPTTALTGIGIYGSLAVLHALGAATADLTTRE